MFVYVVCTISTCVRVRECMFIGGSECLFKCIVCIVCAHVYECMNDVNIVVCISM